MNMLEDRVGPAKLTKTEKLELRQLTQSERATYQSMRSRGYSHADALSDALDGVHVEDLRS